MLRRLLAALVLVGSVNVAGQASAAHPRPEWISGCSAWASGRTFGATCKSGNARFFATATCARPKIGSFWSSYWTSGSYVAPGRTSIGYCRVGYLATNPGYTQ